ncbi:MAG: RHS repeat-associated core domain-containing protein [Flavobacteriales bacterium]|nr:RHS repeat-associated core domain-containing protein [Flavobacteriales bacterium]
MREFAHDPLRRLISATGRESSTVYEQPSWDLNIRPQDQTATNTYTRTYSYDKLGNIQELNHVAAGQANQDFVRRYTYGDPLNTNHLASFEIGSSTYQSTYDANGNLTKEGDSRNYFWGAGDKLVAFSNQAGTSTPTVYSWYFYNAAGERVKKVTKKGSAVAVTEYIDGGIFETSYVRPTGGSIDNNRHYNTLQVKDGNSRMATIRVGNDADDPTPAVKYYLEDHLMDSLVVLQTSGNLVNREEFYPFGETSFGGYAKKRYRYNGKEKDEESGLYNYGQRYYAPWLCRFVSVDPIAEDYPQLSSYNYAGNKPITSVDIEGLQSAVDDTSPTLKSTPDNGYQTFRDPAGNTFRAIGVHNVATAKGADKVKTTDGSMVGTRTDALLQFDFGGDNYKAHFNAKTLDFTAYKTAEGKQFPIEYANGKHYAELTIGIEEPVVTGNEDWHFNESEFSFEFPLNIDSNFGIDFSSELPMAPLEVELFQAELSGKIYFDDLDTDLRELVKGLRYEFVESTIGVNGGMISAGAGITGFKAMNESYQTVIGVSRISFTLGIRGVGKMQQVMEALENLNPSPVNTKSSFGKLPPMNFKNLPASVDSVSRGLQIPPHMRM